MGQPHRDNLLIQATLDELDRMRLPDLDSQGAAVRVSGETIRKWRAGETKRLIKSTRPLVEAFLRTRGIDPDKLVLSRETSQAGHGPTPKQKALAYDAVAAIVRVISGDVSENVSAEDRRKVEQMVEAILIILHGPATPRHQGGGAKG